MKKPNYYHSNGPWQTFDSRDQARHILKSLTGIAKFRFNVDVERFKLQSTGERTVLACSEPGCKATLVFETAAVDNKSILVIHGWHFHCEDCSSVCAGLHWNEAASSAGTR